MTTMDKIWNEAVSKVGRMHNTYANFINIRNRFLNDAISEGHNEDGAVTYVEDHFNSVKAFFVEAV